LEIQWNPGANGDLDSAALWTQLEQICRQGPAPVAFAQGNVEQAMARAAVRVEAEYHQPFLSHAPMEPPSAVVHVRKGRTELWTGTQAPTRVRAHVAAFLGIPEAEIILHNVPIGGSFGRRLETDYVLEAVAVARACSFPVKLVWTREDDIQRDNLRPMYVDRISAGLDRTGMPVAWKHRIASASVIARYFPDLLRPNGVDFDTVVSAEDPVYGKFPNMLVEHVRPKWPPELVVSTVRGSGAAANQFVMESFVDELAHAAKADPLDYRRRLAAGVPRALAVLERVATESGWGKPLPARAGRGVSLQKAFGSFLAVVVEAAVTDDGEVRLQQVTAAVDCGVVVNPNLVRQQLEGGLLFGLSSAMFQEVTFDGGKVQQGNFHDFGTLRMGGSPPVAVHIVPSTEAPGGIGECGSAAAPPALVNALFAATGVRVRSAPIRLARLGRDAAGPG
jgi:isoquinoline 1-oxidoreductase beta subunit